YVEEVLDSRIYHRRLQYLIKWVGYNDPDWLAAEDVNGLVALDTFHQTYPDKPGPLPEAPPPGPPLEPTATLAASRDFGSRRGIVSRHTPPRPAPTPRTASRCQQLEPRASQCQSQGQGQGQRKSHLTESMTGVAEEGSLGEGQC